ncbi:MAG: hypothetical protein R2941_17345 [Desulfobacterales bacterium]
MTWKMCQAPSAVMTGLIWPNIKERLCLRFFRHAEDAAELVYGAPVPAESAVPGSVLRAIASPLRQSSVLYQPGMDFGFFRRICDPDVSEAEDRRTGNDFPEQDASTVVCMRCPSIALAGCVECAALIRVIGPAPLPGAGKDSA